MKQKSKIISRIAVAIWALQISTGSVWSADNPAEHHENQPEWQIKDCATAETNRDPTGEGETLPHEICREPRPFSGQGHTYAKSEWLNYKNDSMRELAIESLGHLGSKKQASTIAKWLKDGNDDIRRAAIEMLGEMGAKEQGPAIAEWIRDKNYHVRRAAVAALVKLGAKEQAPVIARWLWDKNDDVRRAAIDALGKLGAKEQAPAIAGKLKDEVYFVRRQAIETLGDLGAKEQAATIAEWLRDENYHVRLAAVEALGKLSAKEHAPAIAEKLKEEYYSVRLAAVDALVQLGAKEQAPAIAERLKNEDYYERQAAIEALGKLDAKEQAPAIAELLKDENDMVRQAAVEALAKLGAKDQVTFIVKSIRDGNDDIRRAAIKKLGDLGAKEQAPVITEWLGDEDYSVRLAAVEALGDLSAKEQAPAVAEKLKDVDYSVRLAAVEALVKMDAKEQAPAIAERLKDEDYYMRQAAVEALVKLDAKLQAPAIAELLKDKNATVRQATVEALGKLGAKKQVPAIAEWLKDETFYVRQAAAEALGMLDAKEQVPAIAERLIDENGDVRRAAIEALVELGAKEQMSTIAEMLKDENESVRRAAIEALVKLGAKEQETNIAVRLRDENYPVRLAAIEALVELGAKEQVPDIVERFKDENGGVRHAAIAALGELGAKEQAPAIAKLLKDENEDVRRAAAKVLLKLGVTDAVTLAIILQTPLNELSRRAEIWALTHVLAGGVEKVETTLNRLNDSSSSQETPDPATVNKALSDYVLFWSDPHVNAPTLQKEMSANIARMVKQAEPIRLNAQFLAKVSELMQDNYHENAEILYQALTSHEKAKTMLMAGMGLAGHLMFWIVLVLAYPHNRSVQAIFFWNPWVRKLLGLGYVGFLLTWLPNLRYRLLLPFRDVLLADARLHEFEEGAYFRESQVKTPGKKLRPLLKELASLNGQVLLKGESGLGKTSFIRHHLKQSQRPAVFLPAQRCGRGVLPAIQAKLKGYAEDKSFLQKLIYRGALDVYIDGLNEAPLKVRAQIIQFAEIFFRSNLLLCSQPIKWEPPATVRTLELQALDETRIEAFLSSYPLPEDMRQGQTEYLYRQRLKNFLARHFSETEREDTIQRICAVLSNPQNLSVVAEMLARGGTPDVLNLQQQCFDMMEQDYAENNAGQIFPLREFSEDVYSIHKQNERMAKLWVDWAIELEYLAKHRLMFRRELETNTALDKRTVTRWYFRHDKIQDFFLSEAFFDSQDRQNEHMGNARFRGVYFYLARRLPFEQALNLRDRLTEYAADNSDHTLSDPYIQILRIRPDWVSTAELMLSLKPSLTLREEQVSQID